MDLLRKLRTLLGALTHKSSAQPSPTSPGEGAGRDAQGQQNDAMASPARPTLQDEGDDSPEEGRVADLIEQQKKALDRSE